MELDDEPHQKQIVHKLSNGTNAPYPQQRPKNKKRLDNLRRKSQQFFQAVLDPMGKKWEENGNICPADQKSQHQKSEHNDIVNDKSVEKRRKSSESARMAHASANDDSDTGIKANLVGFNKRTVFKSSSAQK